VSTVPAAEPLEAVIGRMAAVISSSTFPTGDRAALRRMVPAQPIPLTFYRFALNYCPSNWQYQRDDWLAITAGIALMSPAAHDPRVGLGAALARHGYSEARLERLLGARGEVRRILFLRAVRFLAAKVQPFNWVEGARFLLTSDAEKREELNFRIARDFYNYERKE
jgi:CRISPR system Cascade subunit CasB